LDEVSLPQILDVWTPSGEAMDSEEVDEGDITDMGEDEIFTLDIEISLCL
jgi:hypothetical protein